MNRIISSRLVVLESGLEFIFAGLGLGLACQGLGLGLGLGLSHPEIESVSKSAYSSDAAQCDNRTS